MRMNRAIIQLENELYKSKHVGEIENLEVEAGISIE